MQIPNFLVLNLACLAFTSFFNLYFLVDFIYLMIKKEIKLAFCLILPYSISLFFYLTLILRVVIEVNKWLPVVTKS